MSGFCFVHVTPCVPAQRKRGGALACCDFCFQRATSTFSELAQCFVSFCSKLIYYSLEIQCRNRESSTQHCFCSLAALEQQSQFHSYCGLVRVTCHQKVGSYLFSLMPDPTFFHSSGSGSSPGFAGGATNKGKRLTGQPTGRQPSAFGKAPCR